MRARYFSKKLFFVTQSKALGWIQSSRQNHLAPCLGFTDEKRSLLSHPTFFFLFSKSATMWIFSNWQYFSNVHMRITLICASLWYFWYFEILNTCRIFRSEVWNLLSAKWYGMWFTFWILKFFFLQSDMLYMFWILKFF